MSILLIYQIILNFVQIFQREEKKKAEIAEKLKKLHENGGQTLGTDSGNVYSFILLVFLYPSNFL